MVAPDHPDRQWFPEANLGLFVHWGLASVDGTVELSWGMLEDKEGHPWDGEELSQAYVPPEEYFALAEEFDPDAYDPDEWLAQARRAGVEYAVLTTKHHDGFCLWPSEYSEFTTEEYLDGRDLVGEFVAACRRQGIRVGLYFSLPDWHHPVFPRPESWTDVAEFMPQFVGEEPTVPLDGVEELADFETYYNFVTGQVRELLTRYGRIDLLWFDLTLWRASVDQRMAGLYDLVRAEQPHVVVNDRGYGLGDYRTPENELPEAPMDGWWELCQVWGAPSWSYNREESYRDLDWVLERASRTVSRGGNLLLNVGPTGDGELPAGAREGLAALAEWQADNAPALADADAGPWPERAPVPVTRNGDAGVWYLHVLADAPPAVTVTDVPEPDSVTRLRDDSTVEHEHAGGDLTVTVPEEARASPDEVVAVNWPAGEHHLL